MIKRKRITRESAAQETMECEKPRERKCRGSANAEGAQKQRECKSRGSVKLKGAHRNNPGFVVSFFFFCIA